MNEDINIYDIREYFSWRFKQYGASPRGLDWNSTEAQTIRFNQLQKVIDPSQVYSLIDYGCGYGAFFDHLLKQGHSLHYQGFDIVDEMLEKGKQLFAGNPDCCFIQSERQLHRADYVVESGIFNVKLSTTAATWTRHVIRTLDMMNSLAKKGLAFNMLTKYSDPEFMREDLYYADPCYFFDYCKKKYSKNVALLHDYEIYDFTIIVRKKDET